MLCPKRILRVAVFCILSTIWIISFAGSARQVAQRGLEQPTASTLAVRDSRALDPAIRPVGDLGDSQVKSATMLERNVFFSGCCIFITVLALVTFLVPLSVSVLSILCLRDVPHWQAHRWFLSLFPNRESRTGITLGRKPELTARHKVLIVYPTKPPASLLG